jgi:iron complex outermembrane receptor protein
MALLYGNSSDGVIQAYTKAAPKEAEVGYQYYVGSYGLHRVDYQFGDTLGKVGIVADYSTMTIDGYRANSATERKQFNGKLNFELNEDLSSVPTFLRGERAVEARNPHLNSLRVA